MHGEKILKHETHRSTVKGLAEIEEKKNNGVRNLVINTMVNKVEKLYKIVANSTALEATILSRVKKRVDKREEPVANE